MKKILLLTICLISLTVFAQELPTKSNLTDFDISKIKEKLAINDNYRKQLKPRGSNEKFLMNYVVLDSIQKSYGMNIFEKSYGWSCNSKYDTLTLPAAPDAFSSVGIIQGFWQLSYLDNNNIIRNINIDSSTITIDSINPVLIYDRVNTSQDDTLYVYVYEDSFNYGVNPSTGFKQDITGVRLASSDTVILKNATDIDTYMYRKSTTLSKGNGFLVKVKFVGHIENAVRGIASYSTNCGTNGDGFALITNYGYAHSSHVVKPSTGNPYRLSLWNSGDLNTTETCKKFYVQNWFIFPYISAGVEPNVSVTKVQSVQQLCKDAQVQLNAFATGFSGAVTYAWSPSTGLSATNIANPIATVGTANVTYTVTVTDGVNPKTAQVLVESYNLAATMTNKTLTSCADTNQSLTVTVTGGGTLTKTYVWSKGASTSAINTKISSGVYSVTVSNAFCTATANANVNLITTDTNVMNFSVDPTSPCVNKDVTFSNTSSKQDWKYVWKNGATQFSTLTVPAGYKFPTAGNIIVSLSSSFGACNASPITKTVVVKASTATGCGSSISNSVQDNIQIFPNPVRDGKIYIQNDMNLSLSYRVTDMLGKVISAERFISNKDSQIDLSNAPNGIYFIEVESKGEKVIKKIIVDKQ
jgi:hypothetical protein